jgi:hypothetical protein
MANGNWTVALYVGERADEPQRAALQTIFGGQADGIMGAFAPLIGTVLGVKFVPITFQKAGQRRSLEIPGLAQLSVHALPAAEPDKEVWAVDAHPFNLNSVAMASGEQGSTWEDYTARTGTTRARMLTTRRPSGRTRSVEPVALRRGYAWLRNLRLRWRTSARSSWACW